MSYIKSVSINGLKGLTRSYDLQPLTYIYGRNKTNKTTIIDAIRVALLGYYPDKDVPKTNAGTMQVASADSMSLTLSFDDRREIHRQFTTDGKTVKGVVRGSYEMDPHLAVCLDHSLYFSKTPAERVQQVLMMSEGAGAEARIPAIKARFKMLRTDDHNEVAEETLLRLLASMPDPAPAEPVQQWLAEVLEWTKDQYRVANAGLKDFKGAGKTLTEANAIDQLNAGQTLDEAGKQLASLRTKFNQANMHYGGLKFRVEALRKEEVRRATLEAKLLELDAKVLTPEALEKHERELEEKRQEKIKLEEQIEKIEAEMLDVTEETSSWNSQLNSEKDKVAELQKAIELAERRIVQISMEQPTSPELTKVEVEIANLEKQVFSYSAQYKEIKEKIMKLLALECCPTCRASAEGWQEVVNKSYQVELFQLDKLVADAQQRAKKLKADREAVLLAVKNSMIERSRALRTEQHAKQEEITAATARATGYNANLAKTKTRYNKAVEAIRAHRELIRGLEHSIKLRENYLREVGDSTAIRLRTAEELKDMGEPKPIPSTEEPEALKELRRQVFEAETIVTALQAQEAERERIAQLQKIEQGMKAKLDLSKQIGETVKDEQAKIVNGAFGPVLELANQLVAGLLDTPLIYKDGVVGRIQGQRFVGVATFSGSEQRATYMAITAALARQAKDKIAIIDEIGTFDDWMRDRLVSNVLEAIAKGQLDQVFICGTTAPLTLDSTVLLIDTAA